MTFIKITIYDEKGIIVEGHAQIRELEKDTNGQIDISELSRLLYKITQAAQ